MSGFGTIQPRNINEIVASIEKQIRDIKADFGRDYTVLSNKLEKCEFDLKKLKEYIEEVHDYTESEYNRLQEQISQFEGQIAELKDNLSHVNYTRSGQETVAVGIAPLKEYSSTSSTYPFSAKYAVNDSNGNNIVETYATKVELGNVSATLSADYTQKIAESSSEGMSALSSVSGQLTSAIDNEAQSRQSKDDELDGDISNESAERIAKDNELEERIATEENTREEAISGLQNLLEQEVIDLTNVIESETERATSAEDTLRNSLSQEIVDRANAITDLGNTLGQQIAEEESRATSAENDIIEYINDFADITEENIQTLENTISSVSSDLSLTINDNYDTLTTNLERESQERSEADYIMNNAIVSETTRALQSESNLDTKIDNEISRSTNKDTVLEQKITTEQNRAETAETNLQTALTNETSRASTAENELLTNLNSEIERATGIETGLRTDLVNEISRATESETTIQTTLQTNIDNEVTRATNAENTLQSNIDSEATLRESTDNTIQTNLSNEITRAIGVEEGLRTDLTAETTRATGVETTLTTNLNNEISNRITADRDLQAQIDTIEATQNIVDIVGTYAELEVYDKTHLSNNDKIQVLQDEIRSGSTIYTWNKDENKWDFIGEFGPYYTTFETNDLLNTKQNNLSAGDGIDITNDVVSHSIKIIENNNTEDVVEGTVFTVHLKNNHYKIITFDKTITEIKFMIEQSPEGILQETGFEFTVPEDSDLDTLSFEVIDLPSKKIYTIIPDSYTPPNIYQGTIVNYRCTIGEYEVED